jgi:protein-tyrosine-phosphatase
MTQAKPTVLFVCTHNAGRSALAAALARARGRDLIHVESAGTDPNHEPNPVTVACLAELGIDDSSHRPTAVTDEDLRAADVVVAMKPGLGLHQYPGVQHVTWSFPDPDGWDVDAIRPLRAEIDARVQTFIATLTSIPLGSGAGPEPRNRAPM